MTASDPRPQPVPPAAWEPVLVGSPLDSSLPVPLLTVQDTLSRAAMVLWLEEYRLLEHIRARTYEVNELENCQACRWLDWARGVMDARKEQP